jgi:hypothetical protein
VGRTMTGALQLFIRRLESVRMKISAQKIFEEFVSTKPTESELEVASLFYASWLHGHTHHAPRSSAA